MMQKRKVPFKALGGVYEQDDIDAVLGILNNAAKPDGDFFPLPEENDFQKALAEHEGASHAIAANSCGTALDLCMMVLDIQPGDEVITTPLTFVCTATSASARGAKVVFADIQPDTMNLDPAKVRQKISSKTRAIVPVHFGGLACDIDAFDAITVETGVPVIYDAAHAVATKYKGGPVGGRGQASCYSFQSNKNITTLGEGGAVTTNDAEFAEKVRRKKTFGYVYGPTLRVVTTGFNYRMSKPQYAVGLTQLAKAGRIIAARQERMLKLGKMLESIDELILPVGHGEGHGSHLYAVRIDTEKINTDADGIRKHLNESYGVGTGKHYPIVWNWEAFDEIDYDNSDCAIAEKAAREIFSLPVFPDTSDEDLEYIADALKKSVNDLK